MPKHLAAWPEPVLLNGSGGDMQRPEGEAQRVGGLCPAHTEGLLS